MRLDALVLETKRPVRCAAEEGGEGNCLVQKTKVYTLGPCLDVKQFCISLLYHFRLFVVNIV
jgi:hypothetical protein